MLREEEWKLNKRSCIHLSSVHNAEDVRIFHKECHDLANAGYEVSLIANHDQDENINGIKIISMSKKDKRLSRAIRTTWQEYKKSILVRSKVYHIHDPELIPIAIFLKFQKKIIIYDAHEDLPAQIYTKQWIPHYLHWPASKLCHVILRLSARYIFTEVIAATPTIATKFPKKKTTIIQNYPRLNELNEIPTVNYFDRPSSVAYIGGISRPRGIFEMVSSLEYIDLEGVRLQLAGLFENDELERDVSRLAGWNKVDFFGWLSREEVGRILEGSRVGLVLLHPTKNYIDSLPIKLFEYMTAGLPVIASNFPIWKKIIEDNKCGICVDPMNTNEIAEAITWLLNHPNDSYLMGQNGRKAVENLYNWETESRKLLELYEKVLST